MNEGCWHSKKSGRFLLWTGEFYFDVVGNFEPKNITPIFIVLANSIISYLGVSYFPFVFLWVYNYGIYKQNCMQWLRWSARMAYREINKKGVEIGERQNRRHDDM